MFCVPPVSGGCSIGPGGSPGHPSKLQNREIDALDCLPRRHRFSTTLADARRTTSALPRACVANVSVRPEDAGRPPPTQPLPCRPDAPLPSADRRPPLARTPGRPARGERPLPNGDPVTALAGCSQPVPGHDPDDLPRPDRRGVRRAGDDDRLGDLGAMLLSAVFFPSSASSATSRPSTDLPDRLRLRDVVGSAPPSPGRQPDRLDARRDPGRRDADVDGADLLRYRPSSGTGLGWWSMTGRRRPGPRARRATRRAFGWRVVFGLQAAISLLALALALPSFARRPTRTFVDFAGSPRSRSASAAMFALGSSASSAATPLLPLVLGVGDSRLHRDRETRGSHSSSPSTLANFTATPPDQRDDECRLHGLLRDRTFFFSTGLSEPPPS